MIMNKRLFLAINLIWMLTAQLSWAGPLVFGPQQFTRQAGSPEREMVTFEVPNPTGTFWLQVSLGEAVPKAGGRPRAIEMQHVVTSGRIWLNGEVVAMPNDFDVNRTKQFGFQKDVTLNAVNTLEVELRGKPGNFISVEIRQAEPNVTVGNSKADLTGWNMGDQVALWWSRDDRAAEYVFYRATSLDGPWEEIFRQDLETAGASGAAVDGTPDARLMDLCYKVKALNTKGKVVRKYEPICVPKFMERQRQGFNLYESPDSLRYAETDEALWNAPQQLTNSDPVEIAASAPVNELCLSDDEFTDFGSMGLNDIQAFLKDKGSFLKDKINDVDEVEIELAQEIFKAAQTSQINP
jgi:hypothetical protein